MDPIVFTFNLGLDFRLPGRKPDKVFVVHGHDHAIKNEICMLLNEWSIETILLNREVDSGFTVIEKLLKNSRVRYAFVILTPDDIAFAKARLEESGSDLSPSFRPRQNVIFELGFFIGKLGRKNVCCVGRKGIELPSDIAGVIYKEVDGSVESISLSIFQELKRAGLNVKLR